MKQLAKAEQIQYVSSFWGIQNEVQMAAYIFKHLVYREPQEYKNQK